MKENEVSSVLGDISSMMLNLSGISQSIPGLHNEACDTSLTKSKRESVLTNTSEDTCLLLSGVSYNNKKDIGGDSHEAEVKLTISYNSYKVKKDYPSKRIHTRCLKNTETLRDNEIVFHCRNV